MIIETGTNMGSTAIIIAQAIADSGRDAILHTIEIDSEVHASAQDRFELAGVAPYIVSHLGDSHQVLHDLVAEGSSVRMAFLDGNHFHNHVVAEFDLLLPALEPDGLVVFDNTGLISEDDEDPRVNGALRTIVATHGGNLINFPFCSWYTPGMALWQRSPFDEMTPPKPESFVPEKS